MTTIEVPVEATPDPTAVEAAVRLGTTCSYRPTSATPWRLGSGSTDRASGTDGPRPFSQPNRPFVRRAACPSNIASRGVTGCSRSRGAS